MNVITALSKVGLHITHAPVSISNSLNFSAIFSLCSSDSFNNFSHLSKISRLSSDNFSSSKIKLVFIF